MSVIAWSCKADREVSRARQCRPARTNKRNRSEKPCLPQGLLSDAHTTYAVVSRMTGQMASDLLGDADWFKYDNGRYPSVSAYTTCHVAIAEGASRIRQVRSQVSRRRWTRREYEPLPGRDVAAISHSFRAAPDVPASALASEVVAPQANRTEPLTFFLAELEIVGHAIGGEISRAALLNASMRRALMMPISLGKA